MSRFFSPHAAALVGAETVLGSPHSTGATVTRKIKSARLRQVMRASSCTQATALPPLAPREPGAAGI